MPSNHLPASASPPSQPVSPVDPDRLQFHLNRIGYDREKTKFLVDGFRSGFRLQHDGPLSTEIPTNDSSIEQHPQAVKEKLNKELAAGRLRGPFDSPPLPLFHVSPAKIKEKSIKGQFRFLHNLSWPYDHTSVNAGIDESSKSVKYASVAKAIHLIMKLPKGAVTRKSDIKSAFKIIPIHPDDHHKLGLFIFGKYYYDVTLPMGAASACQIFEAFSTALEAIHCFDSEELTLHYLDDFFFITLNTCLAMQNKAAFDILCEDVGVPQAPDKVTLPATVTEFLGIELDSESWIASLPASKETSYTLELEDLLSEQRVTLKHLQSVIGKLSFATQVVPARAFLRRLLDKLSNKKNPSHKIKITKGMKEDIKVWIRFLSDFNGVTYFRSLNLIPSPDFDMGADACKQGYGAIFGQHWIQEVFPSTWVNLFTNKVIGISFFEFYPIFVLISMFGHTTPNSNILFHSDNEGVVEIINKQTSQSPNIMNFLRPLVLLLLKYNISLRSKHIQGHKNILCDKISRFQVSDQLLRDHNMNPLKDVIPSHLQATNFADFQKDPPPME